jgi:hypothetical protein
VIEGDKVFIQIKNNLLIKEMKMGERLKTISLISKRKKLILQLKNSWQLSHGLELLGSQMTIHQLTKISQTKLIILSMSMVIDAKIPDRMFITMLMETLFTSQLHLVSS